MGEWTATTFVYGGGRAGEGTVTKFRYGGEKGL